MNRTAIVLLGLISSVVPSDALPVDENSTACCEGTPLWVRRPPSVGPLRRWPDESSSEEIWIARNAVRIGQSDIPGAGRGVFALLDMPSLRILSRYHGRLLSRDEVDILYDSSTQNCPTYLLAFKKGKHAWFIDADLGNPHWTTLVNDPRGTQLNANMKFTKHGRLKTIRRIRAGEELLVDYGSDYDWNCLNSTTNRAIHFETDK